MYTKVTKIAIIADVLVNAMPHRPFIPFGMAFAFICMTLGMGVLGAIMYATIAPTKTEIVEVEVIKEVPAENSSYMVHRLIDPDNHMIVYIWEKDCLPNKLDLSDNLP